MDLYNVILTNETESDGYLHIESAVCRTKETAQATMREMLQAFINGDENEEFEMPSEGKLLYDSRATIFSKYDNSWVDVRILPVTVKD